MVFENSVELAAELEEQNALFKEIANEVAGFFAIAIKEEQTSKSPWTIVKDDQGKTYYWNQTTNETSWDKPADFDPPPKAVLNTTDEDAINNEKLVQASLESQLRDEMLFWVNTAKAQAKPEPPALPEPPREEAKRPAPPSPKPPPPAGPPSSLASPRPAPPSPAPRPPGYSNSDLAQLEQNLAEERAQQSELMRQIRAESLAWLQVAEKHSVAPAPAPIEEVKQAAPPSPKPPPPSPKLPAPPESPQKVAPPSPKPPPPAAAVPPSPRPPPPSPGARSPAATVELAQLEQSIADEKAVQAELTRQIQAENLSWLQTAKAQAPALVLAPIEEAKRAAPPSPKPPPPSPKPPAPSESPAPPSPKPPPPAGIRSPTAAAAELAQLEQSIADEKALQAELTRQIQAETISWLQVAKEQAPAPVSVPRPAPPSPKPPPAAPSEARPPPPSPKPSPNHVDLQLEQSLAEERALQEDLQRQIRTENLLWLRTAQEQAVPTPAPPRPAPPSPKPPAPVLDSPRPPPPSPGPRPPSQAASVELEQSLAEESALQEDLKRQIREENRSWIEAAKAQALPPAPVPMQEERKLPLPSPPPPSPKPPQPEEAKAAPPPSPGPRPPPSPSPALADAARLEQSLAEERQLQQELARQILAETIAFFDSAKQEQLKSAAVEPRAAPPLPASPRPAPPSPAPPRPDARAADEEAEIAREKAAQADLDRQISAETAAWFRDARREQALPPAPVLPAPPRPLPPPSPGPRPPVVDREAELERSLAEEKNLQQELQRQIRAEELAFFEAARSILNAPAYSHRPPSPIATPPPPRASPPPPVRSPSPPRPVDVAVSPRPPPPSPGLRPPPPKPDAEEGNFRAEKVLQDELLRQIRSEEAALFESARKAQVPASSPWEAVVDGEGKTYYWNKETNETSWDKPPGFGEKEDEAKQKAEAERLLEAKREAEAKEEKTRQDEEEAKRQKEQDDKKKAEEKSPWVAVQDADGKTYYWNNVTNETSWDKPAGFDDISEAEKEAKRKEEEDAKLEAERQEKLAREEKEKADKEREEKEKEFPWEAVKDADGKTYYWNKNTNETSWDKPAGFPESDEERKTKEAETRRLEELEQARKEEEAKIQKEKDDEQERLYKLAVAAATALETKQQPPPPEPSKLRPPPPSPISQPPPPVETKATPPPPRTTPPPPLTIPSPGSAPPVVSAMSASPTPRAPPPPKEKASEPKTLEEELEEQRQLLKDIAQEESNFMIEAETRLVCVPDSSKAPWIAVKDADGGVYYWNQESGATTWLRPEDFDGPTIDPNEPSPTSVALVETAAEHKDVPQLTPDEFTRHLEDALNTTAWKQVATPDGDKYWWNQDTGETSWLEPERVQVNPIISKALELTSKRDAQTQRAEARARLKKELEQLDREEKGLPEESNALVEQKHEVSTTSYDDEVEHLGQAAELLMASLGGAAADRKLIQELEAKIESLQQQNATLTRKLMDCQDDRHQLSVKVITMLENQAKAADDLRKREDEIIQNAHRAANQIIANAEGKRGSVSPSAS